MGQRQFQAMVKGVKKAVKPDQLKTELGGADVYTSGATILDGTQPFDVMADVAQAALDAAVTAHVANPAFGLAPQRAADLAALKAKAAADPTFAAPLLRYLGIQ